MKKMKLYCIGMIIVGVFFSLLIVRVIYFNDARRKYNYTTSGDKIRATDFDNISEIK